MLRGPHWQLPAIALSMQGCSCKAPAPLCLHLQAAETRSGWSLTSHRSDVIQLLHQVLPVLAQSDEALLAWQDAAQHTEAALLGAMAANLPEALPHLQARSWDSRQFCALLPPASISCRTLKSLAAASAAPV